LKYLIRMQFQNGEEGVGIRLVFLTLLNMFVGFHSMNGDHLNLGLGVGPMELSFTLHRWNRWLP
jgi:hypothetical protein